MRTSSTATVMWIVPSLTLLLLLEAGLLAKSLPAPNWDGKDHSEILKDLALNYEDHTRDPRENTECSGNASYTGQCNLDCQCVDGKWKCCRLRKSVNNLSQEEKDRFSQAFLTAATNEIYKPAMTSLIWSHAVFACYVVAREAYIYNTEVSYHNLIVFALENLLRLIDCHVTVPYWDISIDYDKSYFEQLPEGFGGTGVPPDYCVMDGPFRKDNFKVPKFVYNGTELPYSDCLVRNVSSTFYPTSNMQFSTLLAVPPESSVAVESGLFETFDANFHLAFRGSFKGLIPGLDPLFYMIHNFINKIMANYQMQGPEHLTGDGRWSNHVPLSTFPWFDGKSFLDCQNFPNEVCVKWDAALDLDRAVQMNYYAGLEVPRTHHIVVPYETIRLMDIDKKAQTDFKKLLALLKKKYSTFSFDSNGIRVGPGWEKDFEAGFFSLKNDPTPKKCQDYENMDPNFIHTNSSSSLVELVYGDPKSGVNNDGKQ
eukprot:scpid59441/ scgid24856/ 